MKSKLALFILLAAVYSFAQVKGPATRLVERDGYSQIFFIAKDGSDEMNRGTKDNPFKTIQCAVSNVKNATGSNRIALFVSKGIYDGETIALKPFVDLYGGFNRESWERDVGLYPTEINIKNEQRAIIADDNCIIDGFVISNSEYRGKGAAIYCDGASPTISNNKFIHNKSLKPLDWNPEYWHETANDGGAIYGKDGAAPLIKNNLFAHNKTENGRGAAIAFDNQCDPQILNNVFLKNESGLDDPMRSSDGGAVSIFRWSKGLIDGNIFLGNYAGSENDAGAVFIALWSSTLVRNNIFVDNECTDDAGALFVGGQEHRYDAPLDPYPRRENFYVTIENNVFIANRNPSMNSGAMRFTMESRGEFVNNIVAQNSGIYFQRSETEIRNNVILDNMLVIETKDYLDKTVIRNNIIWADFVLQETVAEIHDNYMLQAEKFKGNKNEFPDFLTTELIYLFCRPERLSIIPNWLFKMRRNFYPKKYQIGSSMLEAVGGW
ncbi:MAG: right-handed parallel beta-helix repeat-containing protein [candidate division KSB1 bacterium]|nr:right-handed parallel beta-helix repeat-containing protein [candidate division KSB1 bacterium]